MRGETDWERYDRQMRFAQIGETGQRRLLGGRVAVVGCGALGSGTAHNLARAGVGSLRLIDRDNLETSNLHRQVLYVETDVRERKAKAAAAAERLREINSEIEIEPIVTELNAENVADLIHGVDVVADGLDNMASRFLLNEACVRAGIPYVYAGAVAAAGMSMTILPGRGPCLRCLIEELPPPGSVKTCNDVGVINPLTSMVSAIVSCEVMKLLTGQGKPNTGLLRFDVWELTWRRSVVKRREGCPVCGSMEREN